MADINWPTSLPSLPFWEVDFSDESNVIYTEFESGRVQSRRRFTKAPPKNTEFIFYFDDDQMNTFQTFFETTIKHGALRFIIENLLPDSSYKEILIMSPPEYRLVRPGNMEDRLWEVVFNAKVFKKES